MHIIYNPRSSVHAYQQVIADAAEESMKAAAERVKTSPHYATSGEVRVATFVKKYDLINVFIFSK